LNLQCSLGNPFENEREKGLKEEAAAGGPILFAKNSEDSMSIVFEK